MPTPYRICFVCMGNICRSPTAEIVMRGMVRDAGLEGLIEVDSAGTGGWHEGEPADSRAVETLLGHGYTDVAHSARQFDPSWFADRDLIVAMDNKNVQSLRWMGSSGDEAKIVRLRSFDPASRGGDLDVPDPYYDGQDGFERVLAMVEAGCKGLLAHVQTQLGQAAVMRIAAVEIVDPVPVGGGEICQAVRGVTTDGVPVFAKWIDNPPAGFFEAEAVGLDAIRVDGGPPVPAVVAVGSDGLVLEYVEPGRPSSAAAQEFGRTLAALHRSGSKRFGADHPGFMGRRAQLNTPADFWSTFYAERRLRPILRTAVDGHTIGAEDQTAVQQVIDRIADLAGPREAPARIHGDLWSGNVLWAADGHGWLIDAAGVHDGHRETDLAMLQLFGAPHLEEIIASYDEVFPLSDGWRDRVALHQLFPLLIHAAHFGGGYGAQAGRAARSLL